MLAGKSDPGDSNGDGDGKFRFFFQGVTTCDLVQNLILDLV